MSSAAPIPCTSRATMSTSGVGARPHSSEATANQTTPDDEHPPPAEPVAEGAAEQDQGREA